jgi:hypothetical protein
MTATRISREEQAYCIADTVKTLPHLPGKLRWRQVSLDTATNRTGLPLSHTPLCLQGNRGKGGQSRSCAIVSGTSDIEVGLDSAALFVLPPN